MKTYTELDCSLYAWVLLRYLYDSCENAQNGEWFSSPFDENTPSLLGFHGQELNTVFADLLKDDLIEYKLLPNFSAYELKIKPSGIAVIRRKDLYLQTSSENGSVLTAYTQSTVVKVAVN